MNPFKVVRDFEEALCEYTGAPYAVTTTSCTAAIMLAVAWHLRDRKEILFAHEKTPAEIHEMYLAAERRGMLVRSEIEIPKRTYVGVPYAIREAGGQPVFRDEDWRGYYQLKPLPVYDSARWFSRGMFFGNKYFDRGSMLCVSFHWSKTLGIEQGGAILHDNPEADEWLRRARFDGRKEGVPPAVDDFPLARAWHCYMSPATASNGLVRLAKLPAINEPLPNDDYPDLSTLKVFQ